MPRWLTRIFWILLSLGLAAFAYGPLRGAGPVGEDFQVLHDASQIAWPAETGAEDPGLGGLLEVHGQDERPADSPHAPQRQPQAHGVHHGASVYAVD